MALTIALAALLYAPGCRGGAQIDAGAAAAPTGLAAFPAPADLARLVSYAPADRLRLGKDFNPVLPNVRVGLLTHGLYFVTDYIPDGGDPYNGMAFGMYSFSLAGYTDDPELHYRWVSPLEAGNSYWVGLANFAENHWDWYPRTPNSALTLDPIDRYFDPSGLLIVAFAVFSRGTDGDVERNMLEYVRLGDRLGTWITETVQLDCTLSGVSLAYDSHGLAYILYSSGLPGPQSIRFAMRREDWYVDEVDTVTSTASFPCLCVVKDEPAISYRDDSESATMYSLGDMPMMGPPHWEFNPQPLPLGDATCGSLAPGPGPYWSIAYYDNENHALGYAHYNGLTWIPQTVDDEANVGFAPCLRRSALDQACISYYDSTNKRLKLAMSTEIDWNVLTVYEEAGHDLGLPSCLALKDGAWPYISYFDSTIKHVFLRYHDGTGWHSSGLEDEFDHGEANSAVIDLQGNLHLAYMDAEHNTLRHAVFDGTSWFGEALDFGGSHLCGYMLSMAMTPDGRIGIAYGGYTDPYDYTLKYAFQVE